MSLFYKIQLTGRSIPKHIFPDNLWISWQTLSINQWWIVQKIIQQLVGTTWNFVLATKSHYHYVKMSSSDSFTNLETTNLRKCFVKLILFIHTYIYAVNVNNKFIFVEKSQRFVITKFVYIQKLIWSSLFGEIMIHDDTFFLGLKSFTWKPKDPIAWMLNTWRP